MKRKFYKDSEFAQIGGDGTIKWGIWLGETIYKH